MSMARIIASSIFISTLTASIAHAEIMSGEAACGGFSTVASGIDFGPFDYRKAPPEKLKIVQKYHFTPNVEFLRQGESGSILGKDLDFTLRYFPNHTRALTSMIKLAERERTDQPRGSRYRLDCWLDRASRFAPDDPQVSILYGFWLIKKGENALALEQFDKVRNAESRTPNTAYNLGLGYVALQEYEKALSAAHEAYAGGFNFPGLRNKLQKAGKWRDPVATPVAKTQDPSENSAVEAAPEKP